MKTYAVIGLGRFGSEIARELCKQGKEVLAIDIDEALVQEISDDVTHAAVADCQDKNVLKVLGIADFDCAIISIGENLGLSVLCAMNLKELGVPYIVCKVSDETHRRVMEKIGVDKVVLPEKEYANRLAKSLGSTNALDYIELSNEYSIIEIPVPKSWDGKSVHKLNVRADLGINILAVKRNGNIDVSPAANYIMKDNSTMLILGDEKSLKLAQKLK